MANKLRTWQAALAHVGLTSLSAISAVSFFDPQNLGGVLANTQIQLATQAALLGLQGWVAKRNSETAPNGETLFQPKTGQFMTIPK